MKRLLLACVMLLCGCGRTKEVALNPSLLKDASSSEPSTFTIVPTEEIAESCVYMEIVLKGKSYEVSGLNQCDVPTMYGIFMIHFYNKDLERIGNDVFGMNPLQPSEKFRHRWPIPQVVFEQGSPRYLSQETPKNCKYGTSATLRSGKYKGISTNVHCAERTPKSLGEFKWGTRVWE